MTQALLDVRNLRVDFDVEGSIAHVLNDVSFSLAPGETLGLVGESGAGKSVLVMSIVGLLRKPGRIVRGEVILKGRDLRGLSQPEIEQVRGKQLAMIMQNARSALDPLAKIGDQIAVVYQTHEEVTREEARQKALEMIRDVRIPDPERIANARAHQLSGGMAQRISIAMALVCSPSLILADEPTTGLDVTVQRQILDLTTDLLKRDGRSMLLVTHDLGVIAHYCDRVAVLYAGRIIESASVETFFASASHPYTLSLIGAVSFDPERVARSAIGSHFLDLTALPSGCHFHPRCPLAREVCTQEAPAPQQIASDHDVWCHYWREARARV
jgi:oligopeptide/dipeptide ABC transporter ATP-binding protein